MEDISNLKEEYEENKQRKLSFYIGIAAFVIAVLVIGFVTRKTWYPMITKAVGGDTSAIDESSEDSAESTGEFPIRIEGGMDYQLLSMDNALALVDDSKIHIYNTEGKILNETQHTYANPILRVSASKALIYDVGGTLFRLETRYKTVYEKTTEGIIYLAELSDNDLAAVVTRQDKCLSHVSVYNEMKEKSLFNYSTNDGRITNLSFNHDGSACVCSVLACQEGQLVTKLVYLDFSVDGHAVWESNYIPTLAVKLFINSTGTISVIGDNMYALFDAAGNMLRSVDYENTMIDYAASDDLTVVVTENPDLRKTQLLEFSSTGEPISSLLANGESDIYIYDNQVFVLSGNRINVYNSSGTNMGELVVSDQYENLCKIGRNIYLLGYDRIERIGFSG